MRPKVRPAEPFRARWESAVPTTLYLDDLRDAWRLLGQVGTVTAETDTHEGIASFDELAQLEGASTTELTMAATAEDGSVIRLHVGHHSCEVTYDAPKPEFRGVLAELQHVIWRHWRRWSLADTGGMLLFGWPAAIILILFTDDVAEALAIPAIVGFLVAIGLLLVVLIGSFVLSEKLKRRRFVLLPMIWLRDRPPGFLARRGEDIAIQVLVGLFLVGVSLLAGYWWGSQGLPKP